MPITVTNSAVVTHFGVSYRQVFFTSGTNKYQLEIFDSLNNVPNEYYANLNAIDSTTSIHIDVTLTIDQREQIVIDVMQYDLTTLNDTVTSNPLFTSTPNIKYLMFGGVILDLGPISNSQINSTGINRSTTLSDTIFWDNDISSSVIASQGISGLKFHAIKIGPNKTIKRESDRNLDWEFYFDVNEKVMVKMIVHAGKQQIVKNLISSAFTVTGLPQSEVDTFYNNFVSGIEIDIDSNNNNFLKLSDFKMPIPSSLSNYFDKLNLTNKLNFRLNKTNAYLYVYSGTHSYEGTDATFVFCPSSGTVPEVRGVFWQETINDPLIQLSGLKPAILGYIPPAGTLEKNTDDYILYDNEIKLRLDSSLTRHLPIPPQQGRAVANHHLLVVVWDGGTANGNNTFYTKLEASPSNVDLQLSIALAGSTFGDPHINTLDGQLFELPKEKGKYRLIQGDNLILNASTRKINQDEIKQVSILENKHNIELIKDGTYYDNLYIKSDNNILICNLDTQSIHYSKEYFSINNKKITFYNSTHGEINISLKDCNNVMMKNSFNISIENTNNLTGLMESEYLIDTMRVDNLTDCSLKEGIKGKNPVLSKLFIPKKK